MKTRREETPPLPRPWLPRHHPQCPVRHLLRPFLPHLLLIPLLLLRLPAILRKQERVQKPRRRAHKQRGRQQQHRLLLAQR